MNKLIIFDLDGVLVNSKEIHFNALNYALQKVNSKYIISQKDQKLFYEGLPTKIKLKILTEKTGLDPKFYEMVWKQKQEYTKKMFENLNLDNELIFCLDYIKKNNINIAVASNSISETINVCLKNLGIIDFVDYIVGNEDVKNSKPHPEMYWKCMTHFSTTPTDTIIFEDSIVGKIAAQDSGARLIHISDRSFLNIEKINNAVNILNNSNKQWQDDSLNVLIPMAGLGNRFLQAGYSFPKPLVDVNNKPMIQAVVESLNIKAKYTYVVQKEHYEKYNLYYLLNLLTPNCNIIQIDSITEGAAITCLKAEQYINNEKPLLIVNSDQIIDWSSSSFMYGLIEKNADAGIAVFESSHPKWSYVKVNENNLVVEVAEKKVISNLATVGVYYWKRGKDFVKYAKQMIEKNIRTNDEFYVCPVFNEAIQDNKNIYIDKIKKMWGIGTPEDLNEYLLYLNNNQVV